MIIKVIDSAFDLYLKDNRDLIKEFYDNKFRIVVWDVLGLCEHLYSDMITYYSRSTFDSLNSKSRYNLYLTYERGAFRSGTKVIQDLFQIKDMQVYEDNLNQEIPPEENSNILFIHEYMFVKKGLTLKEINNLKTKMLSIR